MVKFDRMGVSRSIGIASVVQLIDDDTFEELLAVLRANHRSAFVSCFWVFVKDFRVSIDQLGARRSKSNSYPRKWH